eukprot:4020774-Pyramimonas_sp.AAC.1
MIDVTHLDPLSHWRTTKHIMTLAAQKARDALLTIQPSELKDDDPSNLCEARAMTLRSISRGVWYQDRKTANLLL